MQQMGISWRVFSRLAECLTNHREEITVLKEAPRRNTVKFCQHNIRPVPERASCTVEVKPAVFCIHFLLYSQTQCHERALASSSPKQSFPMVPLLMFFQHPRDRTRSIEVVHGPCLEVFYKGKRVISVEHVC